MMPDLLAAVTCGDTPNNGLEEVEDVPQRHRVEDPTPNNGLEKVEDMTIVEDPTPLPKTTFAPIKHERIRPDHFRPLQN